MPSPNELKKAKYRALGQLFEVACLNAGWTRPDIRGAAPPTWLALGPQRRASYCAAERIMNDRLLDQLVAEYEVAGDVRNSAVWACLGEEAAPGFLEQKLRSMVGGDDGELELQDLLDKLARSRLEDGPFDLGLVVRYLCALRLSRTLGRHVGRKRSPPKGQLDAMNAGPFSIERPEETVGRKDLPGMLAMRLARALYMLSVDELLAPLAREVWIYAGHMFVSGLKVDDARVRFSEDAFEFACQHVKNVEASITLDMMLQQPARRVSPSALREIVAGVLFGLTEPTCSKAYRTMTEVLAMGVTAASSRRGREVRSALILEPIE